MVVNLQFNLVPRVFALSLLERLKTLGTRLSAVIKMGK
jgi:hypothetical protein